MEINDKDKRLFDEMNYDHLTGLPSMTYFFRLAEAGRKSMQEKEIESALVFMNFNGMKFYNKRYGFAEGDLLLKELALLLKNTFGEDHCSRFGQDHFAVFTEAQGLEEKLKKIFAEAEKLNAGKSLKLRVGIYPDAMGLVETAFACDRAKYASIVRKDEHNSYYNFFDDSMLAKEINTQYIVDHIDEAIRENWIRAFYQPIVRATSRKVCDEEALARWFDPVKGMLSPGDFIPILEDTRLIYRVDLHIVDLILERMKKQKEMGMELIPVSVNLSRTDFETCDIVEEINSRFEAAQLPKDLITVEITESVVGENFDFMREQISRFQNLGFKVWMDDFGSGYSSLDLLQELQFDLIKFDMRFMRQFETSPRSRIILTELMRMAQSLGIETICEGVETAEQADFLSEIGCTKMQGYFFCKPVPVEEIWEKYRTGMRIGYENPDETEYYRTVGAVNMYDLSSISGDETESEDTRHYFDTLPMAVVEYDGQSVKVARSNKSYREFVERYFNVQTVGTQDSLGEVRSRNGGEFIEAIRLCRKEGHRIFLNEKMGDGSTIHAMLKKVMDNPVTEASAFVVAVLDITPEQLTYADVAQALSSDYVYLYYVDTETEEFVQYSSGGDVKGISAERHGEHFFSESLKDAEHMIYEGDREAFCKNFTKENILKTLDESGVFVYTYRLLIEGTPAFVTMKIVRMRRDDKHIIIGVNNVDAQMRQQEAIERLQEEKITFSRISALIGNFIAIYTVDPDSGNYMEYTSSEEYSGLGTPRAGLDFFEDSLKNIRAAIYPEDLDYFNSVFSKEQILKRTKSGKIYKIRYRLMINQEPVRVSLRAGLVIDKDGPQLVVGVGMSTEEL